MGDPLETMSGNYSYADYLTWSEEERWELIRQISNDLIDKTCKV